MYSAIELWHGIGTMHTCKMTLLTSETLILWVSFANTTMRYVRLHKQSTLLRKYPPKGIQNLWLPKHAFVIHVYQCREKYDCVLPKKINSFFYNSGNFNWQKIHYTYKTRVAIKIFVNFIFRWNYNFIKISIRITTFITNINDNVKSFKAIFI